jgi:hypothetical protein
VGRIGAVVEHDDLLPLVVLAGVEQRGHPLHRLPADREPHEHVVLAAGLAGDPLDDLAGRPARGPLEGAGLAAVERRDDQPDDAEGDEGQADGQPDRQVVAERGGEGQRASASAPEPDRRLRGYGRRRSGRDSGRIEG